MRLKVPVLALTAALSVMCTTATAATEPSNDANVPSLLRAIGKSNQCLDSSSVGNVYTRNCTRHLNNPHMKWRVISVKTGGTLSTPYTHASNKWVQVQNVATKRCLADTGYKIVTQKCNANSDQQRFNFLRSKDQGPASFDVSSMVFGSLAYDQDSDKVTNGKEVGNSYWQVLERGTGKVLDNLDGNPT
ncbi:hypothetical protein OG897_40395 [Streptomyces sp. NBC_00237]|uniref:RICIN domain-containing protein n=1 Tax=Streptomyces sp. NBC_00237 TaxID=2975687 RepID=UPI00225962BC|nr:hypothetical protein [Streptomyces sp. NBC_00237]MCX5207652.1 hypothetical protein [Streptomyces sp. NBC_00237]